MGLYITIRYPLFGKVKQISASKENLYQPNRLRVALLFSTVT